MTEEELSALDRELEKPASTVRCEQCSRFHQRWQKSCLSSVLPVIPYGGYQHNWVTLQHNTCKRCGTVFPVSRQEVDKFYCGLKCASLNASEVSKANRKRAPRTKSDGGSLTYDWHRTNTSMVEETLWRRRQAFEQGKRLFKMWEEKRNAQELGRVESEAGRVKPESE